MNIHIKALLIGFAVMTTISLLCWLFPIVMVALLFIGVVGLIAWMIGSVYIMLIGDGL